jgi:hypothetical protein
MNNNCKNCIFFHKEYYICQRYPRRSIGYFNPISKIESIFRGEWFTTSWNTRISFYPETREDDWCGEYKGEHDGL